ncbi:MULTISPECIES: hypothetical protein [unclassified Planococcus (in: firmicutes)]|uniref:hypothetical protein n=1 Tax=unclassified Planococcus (in: firmicutes) TaxID=2662419 RepID=UPI000C321FDC|nr:MULTISPECIES: hypothetical protein [unclassified Planococcus (in: firmicutes)]AUD13228.1 hypothetical protein CW734_05400 [Planococcus sp. MB-3u-03]PKG46005.1 hypothetical protein CXF66_09890 [Planococcus sp. Urea-trap-24]PKG89121.1 hypothetical protein CXF91_09865 [Planococcus sp. Urea-3u-39]PKH39131.1 hypothetical protein CXF77_10385 [Planococcus sp. MB-3u-09]
MVKSRSRSKEIMIISGNRSNFRFVADLLITLFFWVYTVIVMIFILSATTGFSNIVTRTLNTTFKTTNSEVQAVILFGFIVFIVLYLVLFINRLYNKKRFGKLTRRTYPETVTERDLLSLQLMSVENIEKLQSNYVVFERNPIISLEEEKIHEESD